MGDHLCKQAGLCDLELTSAKIFDDFRECQEVLDSVAVLFRENYPFDFRSLRSALTARVANIQLRAWGSLAGRTDQSNPAKSKSRVSLAEQVMDITYSVAEIWHSQEAANLNRAERPN